MDKYCLQARYTVKKPGKPTAFFLVIIVIAWDLSLSFAPYFNQKPCLHEKVL